MLLKDKIVIISGIGPGLGVKLAVEAARAGAKGVVVAARSPEKLDDAEQRIKALGAICKVLKVPTDITEAAQCTRLAERTTAEFGRIDGLVNSAFFHGDFAPMGDISDDSWEQAYRTNVKGSVQLTLAVAPQMKAQGGGAVVMINTLASFRPFAGEAAYAASKAGLLAGDEVPRAGARAVEHPRQHRAHELDVGRARAGATCARSARRRGIPEQQITDAIAANDTVAAASSPTMSAHARR
jgi:NAD(P)-dependent dehydrogenase (short-subunit alcohol dehydrogenase family)